MTGVLTRPDYRTSISGSTTCPGYVLTNCSASDPSLQAAKQCCTGNFDPVDFAAGESVLDTPVQRSSNKSSHCTADQEAWCVPRRVGVGGGVVEGVLVEVGSAGVADGVLADEAGLSGSLCMPRCDPARHETWSLPGRITDGYQGRSAP